MSEHVAAVSAAYPTGPHVMVPVIANNSWAMQAPPPPPPSMDVAETAALVLAGTAVVGGALALTAYGYQRLQRHGSRTPFTPTHAVTAADGTKVRAFTRPPTSPLDATQAHYHEAQNGKRCALHSSNMMLNGAHILSERASRQLLRATFGEKRGMHLDRNGLTSTEYLAFHNAHVRAAKQELRAAGRLTPQLEQRLLRPLVDVQAVDVEPHAIETLTAADFFPQRGKTKRIERVALLVERNNRIGHHVVLAHNRGAWRLLDSQWAGSTKKPLATAGPTTEGAAEAIKAYAVMRRRAGRPHAFFEVISPRG